VHARGIDQRGACYAANLKGGKKQGGSWKRRNRGCKEQDHDETANAGSKKRADVSGAKPQTGKQTLPLPHLALARNSCALPRSTHTTSCPRFCPLTSSRAVSRMEISSGSSLASRRTIPRPMLLSRPGTMAMRVAMAVDRAGSG